MKTTTAMVRHPPFELTQSATRRSDPCRLAKPRPLAMRMRRDGKTPNSMHRRRVLAFYKIWRPTTDDTHAAPPPPLHITDKTPGTRKHHTTAPPKHACVCATKMKTENRTVADMCNAHARVFSKTENVLVVFVVPMLRSSRPTRHGTYRTETSWSASQLPEYVIGTRRLYDATDDHRAALVDLMQIWSENFDSSGHFIWKVMTPPPSTSSSDDGLPRCQACNRRNPSTTADVTSTTTAASEEEKQHQSSQTTTPPDPFLRTVGSNGYLVCPDPRCDQIVRAEVIKLAPRYLLRFSQRRYRTQRETYDNWTREISAMDSVLPQHAVRMVMTPLCVTTPDYVKARSRDEHDEIQNRGEEHRRRRKPYYQQAENWICDFHRVFSAATSVDSGLIETIGRGQAAWETVQSIAYGGGFISPANNIFGTRTAASPTMVARAIRERDGVIRAFNRLRFSGPTTKTDLDLWSIAITQYHSSRRCIADLAATDREMQTQDPEFFAYRRYINMAAVLTRPPPYT